MTHQAKKRPQGQEWLGKWVRVKYRPEWLKIWSVQRKRRKTALTTEEGYVWDHEVIAWRDQEDAA